MKNILQISHFGYLNLYSVGYNLKTRGLIRTLCGCVKSQEFGKLSQHDVSEAELKVSFHHIYTQHIGSRVGHLHSESVSYLGYL